MPVFSSISLAEHTKVMPMDLVWNLSHFHSSTYNSASLAQAQPLSCLLLSLLRSEPRMMPIGQSCQRNIAWVNVRCKLCCCCAHAKSVPLCTDPGNSDPGSYLMIYYLHLRLKYYLPVCVSVCACTLMHMQRSEGSFVASGLSFHFYVGSGD